MSQLITALVQFPIGQLRACECDRHGIGGLAYVPRNQLMMQKLMINQAYDNMGLRGTQILATLFDGITRHFFVNELLKAHATDDHPLVRPWIEEILRDLKARPPALIFAGDPPFPALRRFLDERYLPSLLSPPVPDGRGLWVERERYGEFHARTPAKAPVMSEAVSSVAKNALTASSRYSTSSSAGRTWSRSVAS